MYKIASIIEILIGLAMGGSGGFIFWLFKGEPGPTAIIGLMLGVPTILLSIFLIIFGINLLKLKKWAWLASVITLIITLIIVILFFAPLRAYSQPVFIFLCLGVIICLMLLILGRIKERGISVLWKKILVITALIIAGIMGYYLYRNSQQSVSPPITSPETGKPIIEEETADWEVYRNEEYGFEIRYPVEMKEEETLYQGYEGQTFCSIGEGCYTSLFSMGLSYSWEEPPFQKSPLDWNLDPKNYPICFGLFFVQVLEKPSPFSLGELKEKYKKSEYIIVDGVKGLRRNEFKGEPPGGGGNEDVVYLPKNSKLYLVRFIVDGMFFKENMESCVKGQTRVFNEMLSTFKFIER